MLMVGFKILLSCISSLEARGRIVREQMLTFVECGDDIYPAESIAGFNPIMSVVPLDGENVTKGMVAYLTLGVAA
jgi:hypothetical protein